LVNKCHLFGGKTAFIWRHFGNCPEQPHWFRSTIPLISFNNLNGFVQRIQWFCFSNLPLLLVDFAA